MGEQTTTTTAEVEIDTTGNGGETETETNESAEVKRLKAEMARQKAALDKATKEAAEFKRAARASKSAEEQAAEERAEQLKAMQEELDALRKDKAVSAATAKLMALVPDGTVAGQIAECLYGAEDVDAAIESIGKAWAEREKKLKLEYSKIPAPAAGGANGPTVTVEQLNAMGYSDRVKFANEHPDEYNKLMGRG